MIGFLFIASLTAYAQTNSWNEGTDGFWETAGDWSLDVAPTNTQSLILITNAATKEVTISSSTPASALTISNLTINGTGGATNTLTLTNAVAPLTVASNVSVGVGGVIQLFGSQLLANGIRGPSFVVDGKLTLDGIPTLSVTGRIDVGQSGNGTVLIQSGTMTAQVGMFVGESAGVTGSVWQLSGQAVINGGNGSQWGTGGGVGNVTVSNGTMQVVSLLLGRSAGLQSTFTVAGGTATLRGFCVVGYDPGAGGAVWVSGGQLLATNITTTIGDQGNGQMTVSNGVVLAGTMNVGEFSGSQGMLTVAGGDMSVFSGLVVGSGDCNSTATVLVASGTLSVTNAAHNATLTINSGTFTLNSGTLTVDNLVINNACARFLHTGGTLVVNGTVTANPSFDSDGDGMPNGYEDAHGFDKFNPADAAQDADGDGQNNLAEYLSGTDPTNNASTFRITSISQVGSDVFVVWMMGAGKTNALQVTLGAGDGSYETNGFTTLFTVTNTVGTTTNYQDVGGAASGPVRYYRVRLVP